MSDIFRDWSFGGQLRLIRLRNEVTLREHCKKIKMNVSNLSKLETSKLSPPRNFDKIKGLLKGLEASPLELEMLVIAAFNFHLGEMKKRFIPSEFRYLRGLSKNE